MSAEHMLHADLSTSCMQEPQCLSLMLVVHMHAAHLKCMCTAGSQATSVTLHTSAALRSRPAQGRHAPVEGSRLRRPLAAMRCRLQGSHAFGHIQTARLSTCCRTKLRKGRLCTGSLSPHAGTVYTQDYEHAETCITRPTCSMKPCRLLTQLCWQHTRVLRPVLPCTARAQHDSMPPQLQAQHLLPNSCHV